MTVLDERELSSAVWLKVKADLEGQLTERRAYNDGVSLDAIETAKIRGEIAHIKRMLAIGEQKKIPPPPRLVS